MAEIYEQLSFIDFNEPDSPKKSNKVKFDDYKGFVNKFKPKKTTDDCYTPAIVYDAIAGWVANEYGVNKADFVRPFYPGYDYTAFDYAGKIVVDNPPFSILGEIIKFYIKEGVKFFLFAPALTSLGHAGKSCCFICTDCSITYKNGANVNTAFLTNLEPYEIAVKTSPELSAIVDAANEKAQKKAPELPKYTYPPEVVNVALITTLARHKIPVSFKRDELHFIRELDSQKAAGKKMFGAGFLTTHEKAAELIELRRQAEIAKQKAEEERWLNADSSRMVWELSEREKKIIEEMEKRLDNGTQ